MILVNGFALAPASAEEKVATGSEVVLVGSITSKTLYGKPNFGLTPERDEKYLAYFFKFSPAICFTDTVDSGDLKRGDAILDSLQLTTFSDNIDLSDFLGRKIRIKATVMSGVTGYWVTPYFLEVNKVDVVPKIP